MLKDATQDLRALVRKTEGLQPWRRVFHAANGLIIVAVLLLQPLDARVVIWIIAGLLVLLFLVDWTRLAIPRINQLFFRFFLPLASPREEGKLASSTWYLLGVLLALVLFPLEFAIPGVAVLALADPAASVLGRALGNRKIGKGTLEGSVAFVVVAALTLLPFVSWPAALITAVLVALVEVLPWPLDDNLSIPLATAGALLLLG